MRSSGTYPPPKGNLAQPDPEKLEAMWRILKDIFRFEVIQGNGNSSH